MRTTNTKKNTQRIRRKIRIRSKISGTSERPRLSVFKSNKYLSAQLIDDVLGKTIISGSTKTIKGKTMIERSNLLGKELAKEAKVKGVEKIVFDRGGYIYTGNIAALAQGARDGGLKF